MYDVLIAGGGPAGLSAALVLGRCRRRVLLCDSGAPRNAASRHLHGYLTRDHTPPLELLRLGRDELRRYDVEMRAGTVTDVQPRGDAFDAVIDRRERVEAMAVLLATGVRDELPPVAGLDACYGVSVHHCPYCDGWEVRDKRLLVIGQGAAAAGLALALKTWSDRITVCAHGPRLRRAGRQQLAARGIALHEGPLPRLDHREGQVYQAVLADGTTLPCDAVFFSGHQVQQSDFARRLGCEFTHRGTVKTDHLGATSVPGIFVVGDASRDVQFAIVAAAEGAKAGVAINKALQARAGLVVARGAA